MKVKIQQLKEHSRSIAIVDRGENPPAIYALDEIAKEIDWIIGSLSQFTDRQNEMLEIAVLLIRFADTEGVLDDAEITTPEPPEPPDRDDLDDAYNADRIDRENPLVPYGHDRPTSDSDIPF